MKKITETKLEEVAATEEVLFRREKEQWKIQQLLRFKKKKKNLYKMEAFE